MLLLVALGVAGCARVVVGPAPADVRTIAVFPVDNRTGDALYADAPPLLGILRDAPDEQRVTAADVLTEAFRRELAARGFALAPSAGPADGPLAAPVRSPAEAAQRLAALGSDATALFVQLWLWDSTAQSHVVYVDVKLDAFLVAPATGRILWQAHFPASPVAAGGAGSVSLAYPEVARRVVAATIADLRPAGAAPGP